MGNSDQNKAGQLIQLTENKKFWMGNMLQCFLNVWGPEKKEPDVPWELPFDSIRSLEYIGSGAQGAVFVGNLNGETIAIKKVRTRGEVNIKHLRYLNHENIVRFLGICDDDPYYCLVMEYCQYGSLFDFLQSGNNLMPGQVMRWAKDISLGMDYLHSKNILHRDLKSPNVLIGDNLMAKVSDFGTSRECKNSNSTTMSFTGTVAWMAPEIIRHEPCSNKIDVWAFGVVLWEMITRESPYKHMESHAIMWGVGTDVLSLPVPSDCPESVQVLMRRCWQRTPRNRPSFKTIAASLEMATPDIVAIGAAAFSVRQAAWGAEVRENMNKIYAKTSQSSHSEAAVVPNVVRPKPRRDLRHVKEVYEQQINRANELFMEVCAVRLQLEQRERALAEREKMLKACRCGGSKEKRRNVKMSRQQSTTSSDGKPVNTKQPRTKIPEQVSQLLVNYEEEEAQTYTVAIGQISLNDNVQNNNVNAVKDTVVERNGNVETVMVHKHKLRCDNVVPDVV